MNLRLKFLMYFTIIAITYVLAEDSEMTVKDVTEALMPFGEECDPKPEEEHVIEVVKNIEDAQYISKCFRHCLMSQFEMIEEGSQTLDRDKTVGMMGTMFPDRKDELGQIVDDCNEKNQGITEKCENAHAHGMCILSLMKAQDFEMPELKDE